MKINGTTFEYSTLSIRFNHVDMVEPVLDAAPLTYSASGSASISRSEYRRLMTHLRTSAIAAEGHRYRVRGMRRPGSTRGMR